jgi:exopolysaccharide biosynthesis polyprenyl glycosylphosphotransferase
MHRWIGLALALSDAACIAASLAAARLVWFYLAPNLQRLVQPSLAELWLPNPWMPAGLALLAGWLLALRQAGLYDPGRMENSVRIASAVGRAAAAMAMAALLMNFLLADRVYARGLLAPFVLLTWASVSAARLTIFRVLLRLEAPPTAANALIIGTAEDAEAMAERLGREARHVCNVAGFVRTGIEAESSVNSARILGGMADIGNIVNSHDIHTVIVATRALDREDAMRLAVQADRMGLRVLQAPYSWGVVSPRLRFARVGGLDLIDLAGVRYTSVAELVKRMFDVLAVLCGAVVVLPICIVVALLIKGGDGGPVLYRSKRTGRGGRVFDFLKFRSMVVNADRLKDALRDQNESDGRLFKIRNDPRITPIGRFIRKYSVDELPQLLNVLRGDMNLVGPRPLPVEDLSGIEGDAEMRYWFEQRHRVNPGITGLWQVSGRSDVGFAAMVRHDIRYIQDWSLWLDLQILVKTVPAVLRGRGAS